MKVSTVDRCFVVPLYLIAALATLAAGQTDPHVGTWDLDLAKSTFSPGPPPQRQTLWYKMEGRELTALLQGVDGAGRPISPDPGNLTIHFDRKDHPTPRPGYDTSNWQRISPNKYVVHRKKAGKIVLTSTNVVSNDGRTLTITTTGIDEDGRAVNDVRVYNKRSD